jgi:hypothetical protein
MVSSLAEDGVSGKRSKYENQGLLLDTERIDSDVVSAYSASIQRRDIDVE